MSLTAALAAADPLHPAGAPWDGPRDMVIDPGP
jgi:hypothetical protein